MNASAGTQSRTHVVVDVSHSQRAITACTLTLTCLLPFFGCVSEYTSKCVLFVAGLAVFALGSLACGLAVNLTQLICFRAVQAIGGLPSTSRPWRRS